MAITLAEAFLDLGDHDRASAVFDSISGTSLETASREGEVRFRFDRVKGLLLARQGTDRARQFIEAMGETGESTIDAGGNDEYRLYHLSHGPGSEENARRFAGHLTAQRWFPDEIYFEKDAKGICMP